MKKVTIAELSYVGEMRQRLGLEKDDTHLDKQIEEMDPMNRVSLIFGWFLGDPRWAKTAKDYFKSQGIYLTTDPEANEVIK